MDLLKQRIWQVMTFNHPFHCDFLQLYVGFFSCLLEGKVVGRSLMGPKSLCFLFVSEGQSVACCEGSPGSRTRRDAKGKRLSWAAVGSARSALFTLRPEVYNVCWHMGRFVTTPRADWWTLLCTDIVSRAHHPSVPVQSAVNSHHLTNEHICSCEHKVQDQVKEWRPSIFNCLLTWCSDCDSVPEATSYPSQKVSYLVLSQIQENSRSS